MDDWWKEYFEKQNKAFKRDVLIFAIMISWGAPLAAWCIVQAINGVIYMWVIGRWFFLDMDLDLVHPILTRFLPLDFFSTFPPNTYGVI